jgi:hypothetical protein
MFRTLLCCISLLFFVGAAAAAEPADEGDKLLDGMSIVGNDEAPKSLVIVPWKSSGLGDALAVSRILDDGRRPVDRDVFARELDYYEIMVGSPTEPVSNGK